MRARVEPAVTADELRLVLAESPFARIHSFHLESFGPGECTLRIPFQKELERPGGIVAGAVLMTVSDVAMWLAIMTLLGKDTMTVTTELKTTFLNSARREDVICTARVLKPGKTLIYGLAECRSPTDVLLSHHTITYIKIPS
jgi:uncharacterized protein (TIGR00369 family)